MNFLIEYEQSGNEKKKKNKYINLKKSNSGGSKQKRSCSILNLWNPRCASYICISEVYVFCTEFIKKFFRPL